MKRTRNWAIGIAISATATLIGLQVVNAPTQDELAIAQTLTNTVEISITETPAQPEGNCYFQWTTNYPPELTEKFTTEIKKLNKDATITVSYYGEDCIYENGFRVFSAMEADFYVDLLVADLEKREEFGIWISDVMKVITEFPRDEIQGNYGFVEFSFRKNETENFSLRVPIQKYLDEAKDKTGLELFNYFYTNP